MARDAEGVSNIYRSRDTSQNVSINWQIRIMLSAGSRPAAETVSSDASTPPPASMRQAGEATPAPGKWKPMRDVSNRVGEFFCRALEAQNES